MLEKPVQLRVVNALCALTLFLLIMGVLVSIVAVSQASSDTAVGRAFVVWTLVCTACVLTPRSQSYLSGVSGDAQSPDPGAR